MIEFLSQYWPYFAVGGIELVALVISLFILRKKGNTSDLVKVMIDEKIPYFIQVAEASGVPGADKLGFVIVACLKIIKKYVSSADESYWISYIKEQVEACLSTPQKKGAAYGKETLSK